MNNIIVYGIKRTGTSLMTEILGRIEGYDINKNTILENNNHYKKLQSYFNEGIFVNGITNNNYLEYNRLSNNVIKIMNFGLLNTDIKYFDSFKKIIIMNRYWAHQSLSCNNLECINVDNHFDKIKHIIKDKEQYIRDYKVDDGIEYGYIYSKLLIDIAKRKYFSKIIILQFESLFTNPQDTLKILKDSGIDITEGLKLIDEKQSSYSLSKVKEYNLKEFKPGFFKFLDDLYLSLRRGRIDNNILLSIYKWIPDMEERIRERDERLKNKYNIVYIKTD